MIRRYSRLYAHFVRFSFARALQFRVDFIFRMVMDCVYYAVQLAFFTLLFRHTGLLGSWTIDQVYIFTAAFLLVDAVNMTVLHDNMVSLPALVNRGDLDLLLVRPVSPLFLVSFREVAAASFLNVLIASGLLAWALARYPHPLGGGRILLFLLFLGAGLVVFWAIELSFVVPVFWLHTATATWELFFQVAKYAERPHQLYPAWLQRLLLSALPLGVVVSVPVHVLFEGAPVLRVLHVGAVVATSLLFVRWFWRRGLRAYASASS